MTQRDSWEVCWLVMEPTGMGLGQLRGVLSLGRRMGVLGRGALELGEEMGRGTKGGADALRINLRATRTQTPA
jgi:hypothetical protein